MNYLFDSVLKRDVMANEIFDVCDEHDHVIGQAPRTLVHEQNLLHRAVHIWVWDSKGEFMIHLRSDKKDQFPLCYTSSSSGHVDAGETYETAAHRELKEELQLAGELIWVTKLPAGPETAYEHTVLYFLKTDDVPTPDPEEIQSVHYLHPDAIQSMVQNEPERFTPPFRQLFSWWITHRDKAE